MGNYEELKQAVSDVIKTNGDQEITGAVLQNALLTIISTIGTNATFAGIATPETNPGTPDQNVFYIASQDGTYSNFGGVTLNGEVVIFTNKNGNWVKTDTGISTKVKLTELENNIILFNSNKNIGKNRFNKDSMYNIPSSVINGNGDILTQDSYNSFIVTHPILINKGETLYANHATTGTVYSTIYGIDGRVIETYSDKKAISYVDGAAFVRFTFFATDLNVLQVEVGESETSYEPYTETNDTNNYVNRNYISKKIGKNRFDKNDKNVLLNYAMWWDGSLHETPDMAVTGFIPIEYNQSLYCNSAHESTVYSAQYDKDFKYIPNSAKTSKLQVGATNAKWVRYTIPLNRLNDTQVEEGVSSTNYEPYTEFSGVDFNNKLAGRKILWLGTSIPAGSTYMVKLNGKEVQNNYPKMVGELLGCTVYNEAVGSSALKTGLKDNVSDDNPLGFKTGTGGGFYFTEVCLMMTAEEKEDLINNWSSYRVKYGWSDSPETLSETSKAVIRACSYENKVIPYLDGRRELPDLIVIDHGHNDGVPMSGDAFDEDITSLNDRQTFFGAYNLLIDVIRSYHPNMRIVQCGHFSNVNFSDDEYSQGKEEVVKGQIAISDYNGIPIIPLWEIDGWASKRKIKSRGYWTIDDGDYSSLNWGIWTDKGGVEKEYTPNTLHCCDRMHPHSDMSGLSNIVLARSIAGWIKANIWGD